MEHKFYGKLRKGNAAGVTKITIPQIITEVGGFVEGESVEIIIKKTIPIKK